MGRCRGALDKVGAIDQSPAAGSPPSSGSRPDYDARGLNDPLKMERRVPSRPTLRPGDQAQLVHLHEMRVGRDDADAEAISATLRCRH